MDGFLTHKARPTILFFLLAMVLPGCASFTATKDDERVDCPATDPPGTHQPFDSAAQKRLQQLIGRGANRDTTENSAFVRLDEYGSPSRSRDYDAVPWACVKDLRTGLVWEVKSNDESLHDRRWSYTWHEPTQVGRRSYTGKPNGGKCLGGNICDTQAYVTAVNAEKLCGHNDWRLPRIFELHTLLNRKDNCPGTCIDPQYFPNAAKGGYWSSSPFKRYICYAWGVDFKLGSASGAYKNTPLFIRLVRGKWLTSISDSENDKPP